MMTETGGTMNCSLKGKDGERGCSQHLPTTWAWHSKQVLGKVVPQTEINDLYVTTMMVQKYLQTMSEKEVFLKWNQGHVGGCKAGVNATGTPYNSCLYVSKALSYLQ